MRPRSPTAAPATRSHTWKVRGRACLDCHQNIFKEPPKPAFPPPQRSRRGLPQTGRAAWPRRRRGRRSSAPVVVGRRMRPRSQLPDPTPFSSRTPRTAVSVRLVPQRDRTHARHRHAAVGARLPAVPPCDHGAHARRRHRGVPPLSRGASLPARPQTVTVRTSSSAAAITRTLPFAHATHAYVACAECHTTPVTLAAATSCSSCHAPHHARSATVTRVTTPMTRIADSRCISGAPARMPHRSRGACAGPRAQRLPVVSRDQIEPQTGTRLRHVPPRALDARRGGAVAGVMRTRSCTGEAAVALRLVCARLVARRLVRRRGNRGARLSNQRHHARQLRRAPSCREDSMPDSLATGTGLFDRARSARELPAGTYAVLLLSLARRARTPFRSRRTSRSLAGVREGVSVYAHVRGHAHGGGVDRTVDARGRPFNALAAYVEVDRDRWTGARRPTVAHVAAWRQQLRRPVARAALARRLVVQGYAGRGLIQGLSEPPTNGALAAADVLPPDVARDRRRRDRAVASRRCLRARRRISTRDSQRPRGFFLRARGDRRRAPLAGNVARRRRAGGSRQSGGERATRPPRRGH